MSDVRDVAAVILAAGQGTRMRSSLPKVAHEIAGRALAAHVVKAARDAGVARIVVVVGHGESWVRDALAGEDVTFVRQVEQRGTGHALATAREAFDEAPSATFVLNGDGPLVRPETLRHLLEVHAAGPQPLRGVTLATVTVEDPTGLGRIVRDDAGTFVSITEEADADDATRKVREVNPGLFLVGADAWPRLDRLGDDNAQGEMYLTELPALTLQDGDPVRAVSLADAHETLAANDRAELAQLEKVLQARIRDAWMQSGVTFHAPETTYLHVDVQLAPDVTIEPGVVLRRGTRVASGATIGAHAVLEGCVVEEGARVPPLTHAVGRTFSGS